MAMARLDIRARWVVPVGAVAVTGIVIAAAAVASADSAPSLPPRTAAQLLTEVAQATAKPLGPLTATVQQTANLGLPELPAAGQQGGGPSLGSSPETTSIWYRDAQHIRVAEQVPAGETDLRLNGRTLWVWDSKTQTATKYELPAHSSQAGSAGTKSVPELPQSAAEQVLKAVGPTTVVSVQRNVYVAGQAAYQLSLVPRSSKSLVGSVLIAIDASRHIPLRVAVYPRGSSAVAYSIGFTALSFGTPAASNFSFTPPPGATVKNVTVPGNLKSVLGPAGLSGLPLGRTILGGTALGRLVGKPVAAELLPARLAPMPMVRVKNGKFAVVKAGTRKLVIAKLAPSKLAPSKLAQSKLAQSKRALSKLAKIVSGGPPLIARKRIEEQFAKSLPASMTKAQRAAAIRAFDQHIVVKMSGNANNGGGFINVGPMRTGGSPAGWWSGYAPLTAGPNAGTPHVIGTSWLSVLATPASPEVAAAVKQALSGGLPRTTATYSSSTSATSSQAYSSTLDVSPPVGPDLAVLQALLKATVPVHGSWGSGRLLKTPLLSVLVTSKGQILAGAVSPSVLYADVAADAG
jgi:outer membrane lipoprotein-sorting protein